MVDQVYHFFGRAKLRQNILNKYTPQLISLKMEYFTHPFKLACPNTTFNKNNLNNGSPVEQRIAAV